MNASTGRTRRNLSQNNFPGYPTQNNLCEDDPHSYQLCGYWFKPHSYQLCGLNHIDDQYGCLVMSGITG